MADPKELDFSGMLQSDPEYLDLARRRALAQAVAAATLKAQPSGGEFMRSPIAALADALALRNQRQAVEKANADEAALFRRHREAEQAGVSQLASAQGGDPAVLRQLIVQAMGSQYPSVKKLGESMYKNQGDQFSQVLSAGGARITPESMIGAGGDVTRLKPSPPLAQPKLMTGTTLGGREVPYIQADKPGGGFDIHMAPVGTSVNVGGKPALDTEEQAGKYFAPGGKGFEMGQGLHKSMLQTTELLRTMADGPRMGAGAEAFQTLSRWAEVLRPGISNGLSATTDVAKAQLMQRVIQELGGLGNQVSDQDRKAMMAAQGSLETDPTAMRRILMIALKYQMKGLTTLRDQAIETENLPSFRERGMTLRNPYTFSVDVPFNPFDDPTKVFPAPSRRPKTNAEAPSVLPPGVREVKPQ